MAVDLISRVGVIVLMGLWWWGGWWVLVVFWDFHSETEACLLGAGRVWVSWGLHHLGGNLIDMDSNKILCYACFSFSGNCVQS